jgi:hypothetical protein
MGIDTLSNIEKIQFDDTSYIINGNINLSNLSSDAWIDLANRTVSYRKNIPNFLNYDLTYIINISGTNFDDVFLADTKNSLNIDGGFGKNTISYFFETSATVNLSLGTASLKNNTNISYLKNIQDIFGSQYDDTLIGDNNDNYFRPFNGNDSILGNGGFDFVSYLGTRGVNVNLKIGTVFKNNSSEKDSLIGIENIGGSDYNDIIFGDDLDNFFTGNCGDDTIDGGGGINSACYTGNINEYKITKKIDGTVIIQDNILNRDGTDTLIHIQQLIFSDTAYSLNPIAPIISTSINNVTKIAKPVITGTAEASSTVTIYDGAKLLSTYSVGSNGSFSLVPSSALTDGLHNITATATDAAGNVSALSNVISFTVDTVAPISPVLSANVGNITKATQPIITGKTEAGSSIALFDGIKTIATGLAGSDGSFSLAPSSALTDGLHNITANATDAAGNVSALSNVISFTVNTQPTTPGIYSNASKYYTISLNPKSIQVSDHTTLNNVDTYSSISSIKFSDLTLDTTSFTKTAALSHTNIVNLVELYIASFNRAPDSVGLDYWGGRFSDGMSLQDIAKSFFVQPETVAAYPSNMPTSDFVTKVYNNVLSRGPDTGGLNYWVVQLDKGIVSKDSFLLAIINGAMAPTGSAVDRQTLANKEAVGEHYAIYQGLNNSTTWAKDVMSGVTDQMSTVTAANAKADGYAAIAANPATSDLVVKLVGVAV